MWEKKWAIVNKREKTFWMEESEWRWVVARTGAEKFLPSDFRYLTKWKVTGHSMKEGCESSEMWSDSRQSLNTELAGWAGSAVGGRYQVIAFSTRSLFHFSFPTSLRRDCWDTCCGHKLSILNRAAEHWTLFFPAAFATGGFLSKSSFHPMTYSQYQNKHSGLFPRVFLVRYLYPTRLCEISQNSYRGSA